MKCTPAQAKRTTGERSVLRGMGWELKTSNGFAASRETTPSASYSESSMQELSEKAKALRKALQIVDARLPDHTYWWLVALHSNLTLEEIDAMLEADPVFFGLESEAAA